MAIFEYDVDQDELACQTRWSEYLIVLEDVKQGVNIFPGACTVPLTLMMRMLSKRATQNVAIFEYDVGHLFVIKMS